MTDDDLEFIRRWPDKCCTEVTRGGQSQPCDKPAYAVAFDVEGYWPTCIHHARGQALVTLAELLS